MTFREAVSYLRRTSVFFLVLLLLPSLGVRSYEAPEDKEDVFAKRACPAFLMLVNAAYLAGATVELPCACKPEKVQSVVWFFRKHQAGSEETRALTDHRGNRLLDASHIPHSGDLQSRFSIRLFSLLIFRAGTDDSGVYICGSTNKDFFYGYDLDIQEALKFSYAPRLTAEIPTEEESQISGRRSAPMLYRVFTGFHNWSVCDRCDAPGEQVRIGLCYIHSRFLHVRYRRDNQTVSSCGSGAVPRAFGRLKTRGAGTKLEVKSCRVSCGLDAPSNAKLSTLLSFLGFSSDSVPVFYLNRPAGHILTLGCPKARPTSAVAWDRGTTPIFRLKHLESRNVTTTSSRITIDAGNHLVFRNAKVQDSGIYYCWLQGRRAAEIRLLVYVHFGPGPSITTHPDFFVAMNVIWTSYLSMFGVFCLLLLGRFGIRCYRDLK